MAKNDRKNTAYWLDTLLENTADKSASQDDGFEVVDTPTPVMSATGSTNPKKPRTIKAGYDFNTGTMTVVFRDGTWWEYRGVPDFMWYDFTAADSKGRFLRESGLDQWADMGPANINAMPRHRRVQMNEMKDWADVMFGPKKS